MVLSHLTQMPMTEQLAALRTSLRLGMQSVIKNALGIDFSSLVVTVDDVLDRIVQYLREQWNIIHDLVDFHECQQQPGESFDSFYCSLKDIAGNCKLDKMSIDQQFVI